MEAKPYRVLSAVLLIWAITASVGMGYFYMLAADYEAENEQLRSELSSAEEAIEAARDIVRQLNASLSKINSSYQALFANYSELLRQLSRDLNSGFVSLIIDFGNGTVKHYKFLVVYGENNTVLDLLLATGLEIDYTEYEEFNDVFINCIAGVCGRMTGETSGFFWLFYVNTEMSQKGAKQTTVSEGDVVEWVYKEVSW